MNIWNLLGVFVISITIGSVPDTSSWKEPRNFHQPFDESFSKRLTIEIVPLHKPSDQAIYSPNKDYWFVQEAHEEGKDQFIISTTESGIRLTLLDRYPNFDPEIRWINEKLLFIRVYWGRVMGSDYIFDVETGKIIYREMLHDGTPLFDQVSKAKQTP